MCELTSMVNIGTKMAEKLKFIGINTPEQLVNIGSKQAFVQLKSAFPNICLVHLYALEGAIHNIKFNNLNDDTKQELKIFSDSLKQNIRH